MIPTLQRLTCSSAFQAPAAAEAQNTPKAQRKVQLGFVWSEGVNWSAQSLQTSHLLCSLQQQRINVLVAALGRPGAHTRRRDRRQLRCQPWRALQAQQARPLRSQDGRGLEWSKFCTSEVSGDNLTGCEQERA